MALKLRIACWASALSLATLTTISAQEVDTSKLPPPSSRKDITYATDIKPLLEKSCLECHSGRRPKSKYSMETKEGVIAGGSSGDKAIIIGKSDKSILVHYVADLVSEMEMPPLDKRDKYPAFTKEQIGLVRAWIDQGAK